LNNPQPEPWPEGAVALREYIEAILFENRQATLLAEQEREKAASALRDALTERITAGDTALERHIGEQIAAIHAALGAQTRFSQHVDDSAKELIEAHFVASKEATKVAEQEREKAAASLRESLAEGARQGDKQLTAHIDAQIESVRLALVAAKELASQRHEASQAAVEKAFAASSELAHKHNDLLRQGERDKEKFATKNDLASLREIIEKSMEVLNVGIAQNLVRIGRLEGGSERRTGQQEGVGLSTRAITGLVSFAFIAISLILVIGDVLTP